MTSQIMGFAIAVAQAAIDYSKQPPRELQLEAGTSLAIAGFAITFAVLGIFTILIKATSIIAEKLEKRPPTLPRAVTPPSPPPITNARLIAIAAAVAHKHVHSKRSIKPTRVERDKESPQPDPWVLADRLSPPALMERGPSLDDYERSKWRRK